MVSPKINCTGQGCDERDGCRRYASMTQDGKSIVGGKEHPIFNWASFDIERQRFGDCKHMLPVVMH